MRQNYGGSTSMVWYRKKWTIQDLILTLNTRIVLVDDYNEPERVLDIGKFISGSMSSKERNRKRSL